MCLVFVNDMINKNAFGGWHPTALRLCSPAARSEASRPCPAKKKHIKVKRTRSKELAIVPGDTGGFRCRVFNMLVGMANSSCPQRLWLSRCDLSHGF